MEITANLTAILTVFISGLFGLIVAVVTLELVDRRENKKFKKEMALRDYKEHEELYISILSSLDKIVKFTHRGKEYEELFEDLTYISAKSQLLAAKKVNDKFSEVSEILYVWTTEYKASLPTRIGGTNLGLVTSLVNKHKEKSDEIYPDLINSINELVRDIKIELINLKDNIKL
jgi:hypothetical protein